jgi:hypothetical protein
MGLNKGGRGGAQDSHRGLTQEANRYAYNLRPGVVCEALVFDPALCVTER